MSTTKFTNAYGFTVSASPLIVSVAEQVAMNHQGQTLPTDDAAAAFEVEYRARRGRDCTFGSYVKGLTYMTDVLATEYNVTTITF